MPPTPPKKVPLLCLLVWALWLQTAAQFTGERASNLFECPAQRAQTEAEVEAAETEEVEALDLRLLQSRVSRQGSHELVEPTELAELRGRVEQLQGQLYARNWLLQQHGVPVQDTAELERAMPQFLLLPEAEASPTAAALTGNLSNSWKAGAVTNRWPWSRRRRSYLGKPCDDGFSFSYSTDSPLRIEFNSSSDNHCGSEGANGLGNGPRSCCVKWGSVLTANASVHLDQDIIEGATASAAVSGWLGWIPFSEHITCPVCGSNCSVCPTISRLLPSLFPCKPFPMPPCPLKAGWYSNTTNLTSLASRRVGRLLGSSSGNLRLEVADVDGVTLYSLHMEFKSAS